MNIAKTAEIPSSTYSEKVVLSFKDGISVETSFLSLPRREVPFVICVSSQVGCSFLCKYCASGTSPLIRNLGSSEINFQAEHFITKYPKLIARGFDVSYMGIGEPLANYDNLIDSIKMLAARYDNNLKTINISTVGIPHKIMRLSSLNLGKRVHLQISLHSPDDSMRRYLIGLNSLATIRELIPSIVNFAKQQNDIVCINYLLLKGITDSKEHAIRLAELINRDYMYIKLSRLAYVDRCRFKDSFDESVELFESILWERGIKTKRFESIGTDIKSGCGQMTVNSLRTNDIIKISHPTSSHVVEAGKSCPA